MAEAPVLKPNTETSLHKTDRSGDAGTLEDPVLVIPVSLADHSEESTPEQQLSTVHQKQSRDNASSPEYPKGWKFWGIFIGLFFAIFCQALGRTIISVAIPKITSEFNSLDDVGWYGSSYLLTSCCFQLMLGKLYAEFPIRTVFFSSTIIFQGGSIMSAAAKNSIMFIMGRALAGLGAAGITSGVMIIVTYMAPAEKRATYTGILGAATGIASSVAQTIGGVFTDKASWRWCFWINPILGLPTFCVLFLLRLPKNKFTSGNTWRELPEKVDLLGTVFLLPALVCLLLAIQWGGTNYAWKSWQCILLLCLFAALFTTWSYIQVRLGDRATVPVRILKERSIVATSWYLFCASGTLTGFIYYGSIWFQSVHEFSAYQTGISFLAMTIALTVFAMSSGFLASKIGYYNPQMIANTIIMCIGTGLVYGGFNQDTSTTFWASALVLIGMGSGLGMQLAMAVPMAIFKGPDLSLGLSIMVFTQSLAGTMVISIADNIFNEQLVINLERLLPNVDAQAIIDHGASELASAMSVIYNSETVKGILEAYNLALKSVWLLLLVLSCLGTLGAAGVKWNKIERPQKQAQKPSQEPAQGSNPDIEPGLDSETKLRTGYSSSADLTSKGESTSRVDIGLPGEQGTASGSDLEMVTMSEENNGDSQIPSKVRS